MIKFPLLNRLQYLLIRSRWKKWIFPAICALPYLGSIFWLLSIGQVWIAQILVAPLVMTLLIAFLTFILARLEFRN